MGLLINVDIVNPADEGSKYYYVVTHPDAPNLALRSRLQMLKFSCKKLVRGPGFTYKRYLCAINFNPSVSYAAACQSFSFEWNFGDGTTSRDRSAWHSYQNEGSYQVSLHVQYACGSCVADSTITKSINFSLPDEFLRDSVVQITTEVKPDILSVSAATFSDAWPLQQPSAVSALNSYFNGAQGVWRNEGTHVYDVPRDLSTQTNIAKDGTFTLEQFNWERGELNAIPYWIKANDMTQYSPYSYELENKDVLGVYSAALYDYGGHLPSANGVNMRNVEMAFTGFRGHRLYLSMVV